MQARNNSCPEKDRWYRSRGRKGWCGTFLALAEAGRESQARRLLLVVDIPLVSVVRAR